MSERDIKVLLGSAAAMLMVFVIYFVRPIIVKDQEHNLQTQQIVQDQEATKTQDTSTPKFRFRNRRLLNEHYEKHGKDMGFASAEEYEKAAAAVPVNPDALHKTEKEDGDDVYYVQATNEFVIVSGDGFIRTYFLPDSGIKYFNKQ